QVAEQVNRFALPDNAADWMLKELAKEYKQHTRAQAETLAQLREKTKIVDDRLNRLLHLYMEQALTIEEYRNEKNTCIGTRRELDEELIRLETSGSSWLEPAMAFIQAAKSMVFSQNI